MKLQLHHYLILALMTITAVSMVHAQDQPFDPEIIFKFFTQMPLYWYFVCAFGMALHWGVSVWRKKIPGMTEINLGNFIQYFFIQGKKWTLIAYTTAITLTVAKYNADPQGFIVTNVTAWATVLVFGWVADSGLNSKFNSLKLPPQN